MSQGHIISLIFVIDKKNEMKILHISGAKGWGGNEQQLLHLIPRLNELGFQNGVFGIKNSVLQRECKAQNILFIEAKSTKLNTFKNYVYLKKCVALHKPDVIHLHTSDSLTLFMITNILFNLKTKTVFSKKGMGASGSYLSKLKYNYSKIQKIICVSKSVQDDFSKILTPKTIHKTTVIHDCVSVKDKEESTKLNLRSFLSLHTEQLIVGNIANHTAAKDLETFINSVDYFVHKLNRKDVVFVQIGTFSKLTSAYQKLVKEKGIEDFVFFMNTVPKAYAVISQFDVFLMTSQREGGPSSVLDAMQIGVPVVSTRVGVIPDVITPSQNGFVTQVKDFKQLALKTNDLLLDKNLQKEFAEKSMRIINAEFTAEKIALQYQKLYLTLID